VATNVGFTQKSIPYYRAIQFTHLVDDDGGPIDPAPQWGRAPLVLHARARLYLTALNIGVRPTDSRARAAYMAAARGAERVASALHQQLRDDVKFVGADTDGLYANVVMGKPHRTGPPAPPPVPKLASEAMRERILGQHASRVATHKAWVAAEAAVYAMWLAFVHDAPEGLAPPSPLVLSAEALVQSVQALVASM
jgi:hypothetical protein